jgi:hypothetical protein
MALLCLMQKGSCNVFLWQRHTIRSRLFDRTFAAAAAAVAVMPPAARSSREAAMGVNALGSALSQTLAQGAAGQQQQQQQNPQMLAGAARLSAIQWLVTDDVCRCAVCPLAQVLCLGHARGAVWQPSMLVPWPQRCHQPWGLWAAAAAATPDSCRCGFLGIPETWPMFVSMF